MKKWEVRFEEGWKGKIKKTTEVSLSCFQGLRSSVLCCVGDC